MGNLENLSRTACTEAVFLRGEDKAIAVFASKNDLEELRDKNCIAFEYKDNPNGASGNIAGILSENHRVLGMMPHPERHIEDAHGCKDGYPFFEGLFQTT